MARSEDIKTPMARVAFAQNLFKPQESDSGAKKFGCSLLFSKDTDLSALHDAAFAAAKEAWGDKAKDMIQNGVIKTPFIDGDGPQGCSKKTGERHAGFAGTTFIRCVSGEDFKPKVFDRNVNPVGDASGCPSGWYGYAVVNAFTWENSQNGKGISFGISLFQVAKEGEVLGGSGGPDPNKFLEKIADEGEAPSETKSGDGAAGLFG